MMVLMLPSISVQCDESACLKPDFKYIQEALTFRSVSGEHGMKPALSLKHQGTAMRFHLGSEAITG
jgi:hypothetical protein